MTQHDPEIAKQRASQDLEWIRMLRQQPGWDGWWLRRLKQKADTEAAEMKSGETLEKRELARQRLLFLEEIIRMPQTDEQACRSIVGA